jgi:hypothetical protein
MTGEPVPADDGAPADEGASRYELASAVLVGLIAVIVAVLVVLEVAVSHEGARADAEAARLSALATTRNNVSQAPFGFQISKTLEATKVAMEGTSRQLVALEADDAISQAIGAADQASFDRLMAIAVEMGAIPDASSPLDAYARDALATTTDELRALVDEQNAAVDRTSDASTRGMAIVLGLSLAALGGVLVGLAAVIGRGKPGVVLLVLGYAAAGIAFALALVGASWLMAA